MTVLRPTRFTVAFLAVVGVATVALGSPSDVRAVDTASPVVINEVYGGGGSAGSVYRQDFIELYNTSAVAVNLVGWSVQISAANGSTYAVTPLAGSIAANSYYTIGEAVGGGGTTDLPTPYVTGTVDLGTTEGKVALVNASVAGPLTCGQSCAGASGVVDFVGWGAADDWAGNPTPAPAPATTDPNSVNRTALANTGNNGADFSTAAASPQATPPPASATIAEIQGPGFTSPLVGQQIQTSGVVTAAFPTGGLAGYVIQTPGSGGQGDLTGRTTSDGLFVSSPATAGAVTIGQHVQVIGVVSESFGLTQITVTSGNVAILADSPAAPVPITAAWPATNELRESVESMIIRPAGVYTVSDTFSTNRFGEVVIALGLEPLLQPTDRFDFGSPGAAAVAADNAARRVAIDDGSTIDYLNAANTALVPPYISLTDPVRVGARVNLAGNYVVDFRNGAWKLQPPTAVTAATPRNLQTTFENTRTPAPDQAALGTGQLRVASFNVLNYFTTLGTDDPLCEPFADRAGDGVTVAEGCPQRGAWDAQDLQRQQIKIVNAINAVDASVIGLMEIENSAFLGETTDEALATLVAALNDDAGGGKWAFVPSSPELPQVADQDVITNAIIYQPAEVTPLGASRALGTQSAAGQPFSNAREPVGQVFVPVEASAPDGQREPFFVAVNHFKSKSAGLTEPDTGQGNFNESRINQATALANWVPTVLASSPSPVDDVFLLGDFNSYTQEDPMQVLYAAGYTDSNGLGDADFEYTYSFGALSGSLDHVVMNASALARMTGTDIWEINSPESLALEYSRYNYQGALFYDETPFRSSDHDPVIVAFDAPAVPDYNAVGPVRVFDTRLGQSPNAIRVVPKQQVSGDPPLSVQVTDLGGLTPATGVGAVSLNVTVTGSTVDGFVTVYACGTRELVSSVNFVAGQTVANAVISPVSAAGSVCFFSSTPVDLVVDLNGWFPAGEAFNSVGPKRLLDTRPGESPNAIHSDAKGPIGGDVVLQVQLTDLAGVVRAADVGAVSLNVTVTNPTAGGFITVYACGQRDLVSNVNFTTGQTVANAVITPVGPAGEVCFYSSVTTDLVVDVNGWFRADQGYTSVGPKRVFDTRPGESPNSIRTVPKAKIGGESAILDVMVTGLAGLVPLDEVSAVSLNVTATNPEADGFITVYPCGLRPFVSTVNMPAGQTVANAVITPVSASGRVCFYSSVPTDLVVDVNGWIG